MFRKVLCFVAFCSFTVINGQDIDDAISILESPTDCTNGKVILDAAGREFSCEKVNFLSLLGRADLKISRDAFTDNDFNMGDVWGWRAPPPSSMEVTIACMSNGVWFIDNSNPSLPAPLGFIESLRRENDSCDVKVFQNTAYIVHLSEDVSDSAGIQIFDLLELISNPTKASKLEATSTYEQHGGARNLIINPNTGFLYVAGALGGDEDCDSGIHVANLEDRLNPSFETCFPSTSSRAVDGHCVLYSGPDARFNDAEVCFIFTEAGLAIFDVSEKSNIQLISSGIKFNQLTPQQGWLNEDQSFLIVGFGSNPSAFSEYQVIDISQLDNPRSLKSFKMGENGSGGNVFFWGDVIGKGLQGSDLLDDVAPSNDYFYASVFTEGLRIANAKSLENDEIVFGEAGFFDFMPNANDGQRLGALSSFMHPSGTIAVNSVQDGIFFLDFQDAFVEPDELTESPSTSEPETPTPEPTPQPQTTQSPTLEESSSGKLPGGFAVLYIFVVIAGVGLIIANIRIQHPSIQSDSMRRRRLGDEENDNPPTMGISRDVSQANPMFDG